MESPNNFEEVPIIKKNVVDILKSKGPQDTEALELLERFAMEREVFFQKEGRKDARLESLREKAHTLNLADCFAEAIVVMRDVVAISNNEGDIESYNEALLIIDKLEIKLRACIPGSIVKIVRKEEIALGESGEKVSREKVLNAFKKLTRKGTDPADLDENDPEVEEANKLFERWGVQQESGGEDASLRHNFEKTMLFVDAGFHDPEYLKEVLGWIYQDVGDAKKDVNNPNRVQLRSDMVNAMNKIRKLLGSNQ
ncbi:MAG: hypothetical protein ACYCZW_02825 [Minisyncoccota bacterium]